VGAPRCAKAARRTCRGNWFVEMLGSMGLNVIFRPIWRDWNHITNGGTFRRRYPWTRTMACRGCNSYNQKTFNSKVALHFPGLEGLDKPIVWVWPQLAVCLDCGWRSSPFLETKCRC